jgi:hypothetical protein
MRLTNKAVPGSDGGEVQGRDINAPRSILNAPRNICVPGRNISLRQWKFPLFRGGEDVLSQARHCSCLVKRRLRSLLPLSVAMCLLAPSLGEFPCDSSRTWWYLPFLCLC